MLGSKLQEMILECSSELWFEAANRFTVDSLNLIWTIALFSHHGG